MQKNLPFGGGQNFERPNVERPILRNLKIANVQNYEVHLFDFLIIFSII